MTRQFLTVAYYTKKYKDEARGLAETCFEHGIQNYIKEVPDQGSWDANTHYKPTFIGECLEAFKAPILYVDVDARFTRYPNWFDSLNCDTSYYCGPIWYGHKEETLSGTLYFAYNDQVLRFIALWKDLCKLDGRRLDQQLFDDAIRMSDLNVCPMPLEYCSIFDSPYINKGKAVILHYQASRRLREN